jgi:hypothetical protein
MHALLKLGTVEVVRATLLDEPKDWHEAIDATVEWSGDDSILAAIEEHEGSYAETARLENYAVARMRALADELQSDGVDATVEVHGIPERPADPATDESGQPIVY